MKHNILQNNIDYLFRSHIIQMQGYEDLCCQMFQACETTDRY